MRFVFILISLLALAMPTQARNNFIMLDTLNVAQDRVEVHGEEFSSAIFQFRGTWTATITFEGTVDFVTWVALPATNLASGVAATTATANGIYSMNTNGLAKARVRVSAYTSGAAIVNGQVVDRVGTMSTSTTVVSSSSTTPVAGSVAHDAPATSNPVMVGFAASTSEGTVVANQDQTYALATIAGKMVNMPYSTAGGRWRYVAAAGGITNTTAVTIVAAAAGFKACITSIQAKNAAAAVTTEYAIRNGAAGSEMWHGYLPVAASGGDIVTFPVPICGSTNTLLEVVCGTTASITYFNAQGYLTAE